MSEEGLKLLERRNFSDIASAKVSESSYPFADNTTIASD